jgi:hypothetical protein
MLARCGTDRSFTGPHRAVRWRGRRHRGCEVRQGQWPPSRCAWRGHSYPGLSVCDGGIVIDLSLMKGIRVDPEAHMVMAQAGVLLGELGAFVTRLGPEVNDVKS